MKKPYSNPVIQALPAIPPVEPGVRRAALGIVRLVGGAYVHAFVGRARVRLASPEPFIPALERAFSGKSRLIIAFRHQNGWEPQVLFWYIFTRLRREARRAGCRFPRRPLLTFVHGYEVPLWGGFLPRYFLPRIGALPVHHTIMDRQGMDRIYKALEEGHSPLAIAPEGQVSYSLAAPLRVEPGAVRIGFAVAERLRSAGSDAAVEVLPVTLLPEYGESRWADVEKLTEEIEEICGCRKEEREERREKREEKEKLRERFLRLRELILAANERRYGLEPEVGAEFAPRLDGVIDAALARACEILGLPPEPPDGEEAIQRVYSVRQHCWDRIFPGEDLQNLPPLEHSIIDLSAGEAWHASRHMEIADFSYYFHQPPAEPLTIDKAVEYAQNLWDFASRTRGGAYSNRRNIRPRRIRLEAGEPVNITELLAHGGGKKAIIAQANESLAAALQSM